MTLIISVVVNSLKDELLRFTLLGPRSQKIVDSIISLRENEHEKVQVIKS
jgi:hypothetical protein